MVIQRPLPTKNPLKKMIEYSVLFLLDSHMERISWGLQHDGHEDNNKIFGQYVLLAVEGKLELRINEQ